MKFLFKKDHFGGHGCSVRWVNGWCAGNVAEAQENLSQVRGLGMEDEGQLNRQYLDLGWVTRDS